MPLILLLAFMPAGCTPTHDFQFTGATMGTYYSVKVMGAPSAASERSIASGVAEVVSRVDALMSTYKQDSELSRFNRADPGEWFGVSPETAEVIELAQQVSTLSQGSFDVTVGPLVNLWGFGPDPAHDVVPPDEEIARARAQIGYQRLELRMGEHPALRKTGPLSVDLSAIAKGYAVDLAAEYLESRGISSYLVDIGGEMRAGDNKPNGGSWRVAVQSPSGDSSEEGRVLEVADIGIATSGDYRNYFEVDGVRYSHTIDPVTGYPIRHNLASVTVLDPRAARADALATAFDVMGRARGMALAEAEGVAVLFIVREGQAFKEYPSSAFAQRFDHTN